MDSKKEIITASLFLLFFTAFIGIKWQLSKKVFQAQVTNIYIKKSTPLNQLLSQGTSISIVIDKSDYRLRVYTHDSLIKSYPIVFGGNPVDDKLMEGDQCTPEGDFKIQSKYPHKKWSKFIWLNYPTKASWQKHNKAKKEGIIPKNAKIGGEIGIHGVPKGTDYMIAQKINWTLGCISLTNKDINELYPFITKQTNIKIQK